MNKFEKISTALSICMEDNDESCVCSQCPYYDICEENSVKEEYVILPKFLAVEIKNYFIKNNIVQ